MKSFVPGMPVVDTDDTLGVVVDIDCQWFPACFTLPKRYLRMGDEVLSLAYQSPLLRLHLVRKDVVPHYHIAAGSWSVAVYL